MNWWSGTSAVLGKWNENGKAENTFTASAVIKKKTNIKEKPGVSPLQYGGTKSHLSRVPN